MKVIMIKKYQKYEVDQIVEVSNGFGVNFLIKNGYAVAINDKTTKDLFKKQEQQARDREFKRQEATELKKKLEALELIFYLKTTNDVIHGSITTKKVNHQLIDLGIKLDKHIIPHISIASLGITNVKLRLFEGVEANLKVNVKREHGK